MNLGSNDLIDIIPIEWLAKEYSRLGVDIKRLVPAKVDSIRAYKDNKTQLIRFDPLIVGDGRFYEELGNHPWYYAAEKK